MSAIADHSPLPARRRDLLCASFGGIVQNTLATIRVWRRRMRQRRELLMLNDIELRDLSLCEADVNREARNPFWETIRLSANRKGLERASCSCYKLIAGEYERLLGNKEG
jgi:uncharacterized protein YjiS (DUF1127 family)